MCATLANTQAAHIYFNIRPLRLVLTSDVIYPGKTELLALEVSPGVLLRVTTDTGDKHFSEAAQALDPVGTAGHLVSIVVADGIPNTPMALLANHMESALNAAVAQKGGRSFSRHTLSCLCTVHHALYWFVYLVHKHMISPNLLMLVTCHVWILGWEQQ